MTSSTARYKRCCWEALGFLRVQRQPVAQAATARLHALPRRGAQLVDRERAAPRPELTTDRPPAPKRCPERAVALTRGEQVGASRAVRNDREVSRLLRGCAAAGQRSRGLQGVASVSLVWIVGPPVLRQDAHCIVAEAGGMDVECAVEA